MIHATLVALLMGRGVKKVPGFCNFVIALIFQSSLFVIPQDLWSDQIARRLHRLGGDLG